VEELSPLELYDTAEDPTDDTPVMVEYTAEITKENHLEQEQIHSKLKHGKSNNKKLEGNQEQEDSHTR